MADFITQATLSLDLLFSKEHSYSHLGRNLSKTPIKRKMRHFGANLKVPLFPLHFDRLRVISECECCFKILLVPIDICKSLKAIILVRQKRSNYYLFLLWQLSRCRLCCQ